MGLTGTGESDAVPIIYLVAFSVMVKQTPSVQLGDELIQVNFRDGVERRLCGLQRVSTEKTVPTCCSCCVLYAVSW